jgi:hypothetical protein
VTWTPDSQPREPLLWAGNQSAHAMIGIGLALVVGPIVAVLAYFIAWEVLYQVRKLGGPWKDSIADTAFVAVGALLASFPAFALHIYAGFVIMILIGIGYRRR